MMFVLIIAFSLLQSAAVKSYNKRDGNVSAFNILKSAAALLCMLAFSVIGFSFHKPTLLYGTVFGFLLAVSMYSGYKALSVGALSLTSLISSFSVIIPICYGILFCKEDVTLLKIIGFIFMATAIIFSSVGKRGAECVDYKKWVLFIALTFISNGLCSVVQKMHQIAYPGEFSPEFMTIAMAVCFCVFLLLSIPQLIKRDKTVEVSKKNIAIASLFGVLAGVACGMMNLLTIILAGKENASVMYPIISVGTILAAMCYGVFVLKEKIRGFQIIAILSGIISVVFLKL